MSDLLESLKQSARDRALMTERFGFIPTSVVRGLGRGALSNQLFVYQDERPSAKTNGAQGALDKKARFEAIGIVGEQFGYGARQKRGTADYGLSIMPAELVQFFVRYYTSPGDTYLDPFMGQGVRLQVAKRNGLHYRGYDVSVEFCRYIDAIVSRIDDHTTTLSATCGDARFPTEVPDNVGDFCFTSPPYWDIEFYGDEPGQLGRNHTYDEFMQGIEDVARAWLPKFKRGAFVVINVGDFRANHRFYPYGAHTTAAFERAGYQSHDVWIIEGLIGGMQRAFAVSRNNQRIVPRTHEYGLVFRTP